MRTDLSPAWEFDWVETELYRAEYVRGEPVRIASEVPASRIGDAFSGIRLTTFEGVGSGTWVIHARLMQSQDGEVSEVVRGRVMTTVTQNTRAVTVLVTRDCAGVSCPADGDDPGQVACLGGRCVDPQCTPETPELCPRPECTVNSECEPTSGGGECGEGRCFAGTCGTVLEDARCGSEEVCRPEGCGPPDVPQSDAGAAPDAGVPAPPTDAGVDAGGPADPAVELAAGHGHMCARLRSGAVQCWGQNHYGQLGDGTAGVFPRPTPVRVSGLADAVEIAAASEHTCARLSSGEVHCWGRNENGQLGTGRFSPPLELLPVPTIGLTNPIQIDAGMQHTCARSSGEIGCWGLGDQGQLGNGETAVQRATPVSVLGISDAVEVDAAQRHTCARLTSGEVRCWGRNDYGELGDGTSRARSTPVSVWGLTDAVEIASGNYHRCARLSSGEVRCWGNNQYGQLGDGTSENNRLRPVTVSGVVGAVVQLAAGARHTCARLSSGEVRCWGDNEFGQLGDGTNVMQRLTPVLVVGLTDAVQLASNVHYTCARLSSGAVRCWGRNDYGQLGDGTSVMHRTTPTPVIGF